MGRVYPKRAYTNIVSTAAPTRVKRRRFKYRNIPSFENQSLNPKGLKIIKKSDPNTVNISAWIALFLGLLDSRKVLSIYRFIVDIIKGDFT